jgi:hypothetical protein
MKVQHGKLFTKHCESKLYLHYSNIQQAYEGVSKSFRTESIAKYTLTRINTR